MDIMTRLGPRAWYSAQQCWEACGVYDEKTPGLFKTEWDGDGMVALSSKTCYCRDCQGQDKLSSKGLQKKANANSLPYETYHRVLSKGLPGGGVNHGIRVGLGGQVYTYRQERTVLSYVYLKRRVSADGVHTEPYRQIWDARPATAVALSHAPRRLFREWQVHADHSTGGTVMTRTPARVLVFYSHMQPAYRELARQALYSCWTGLSTSPSNWPRSPELRSLSTTCKQPTPAWWVLGSHAGPIIMTRPSFIWSKMFLTKTPATGPSAWMLLTSSCSRTPGTCPKSPT